MAEPDRRSPAEGGWRLIACKAVADRITMSVEQMWNKTSHLHSTISSIWFYVKGGIDCQHTCASFSRVIVHMGGSFECAP